MNWLRNHTVQNKFNVIIAVIIVVLVFGLVNFWFGLKVMSSIRAYVGGEGLWSKSQKDATLNLVKYANSGNEADYQKFQHFLTVPNGDKQARMQLEKPAPNYELARQGFIQGGNNPADVPNLIFLYRYFRHISYMDEAIRNWTEGDADIAQLTAIGNKTHTVVTTPYDPTDSAQVQSRAQNLSSLTMQAYNVDAKLTVVENNFSAVLGAGSRYIQNVLLMVTLMLTIIMGVLAIVIARSIAKVIIQVDKAKNDFVALASHQLRTPATAVQAYATFLNDDYEGTSLSPKQREFVREIYQNNQRLLNIADQMLATLQADSDHDQLTITPTDMVSLITEAVAGIRPVLSERHQRLKLNLPSQLTAEIDVKKMHVIIDNLLSNASKYTPERGVITVSLTGNKTEVVIEVKDTGIGISEADQADIFSKFTRAPSKLDTEGTGLGLYLVKRMVELHGGSIEMKSVEGKGSSFSVKIPTKHKRAAHG